MVEAYVDVSAALSKVAGMAMVDIAPYSPDRINVYPAALVEIREVEPSEMALGEVRSTVRFGVEVWVKNYGNSKVLKNAPALAPLKSSLSIAQRVRAALWALEGEHLTGTALQGETVRREDNGLYVVEQEWIGVVDSSYRKE